MCMYITWKSYSHDLFRRGPAGRHFAETRSKGTGPETDPGLPPEQTRSLEVKVLHRSEDKNKKFVGLAQAHKRSAFPGFLRHKAFAGPVCIVLARHKPP